jgi:hypothetical protein
MWERFFWTYMSRLGRWKATQGHPLIVRFSRVQDSPCTRLVWRAPETPSSSPARINMCGPCALFPDGFRSSPGASFPDRTLDRTRVLQAQA